MPLNWINIRTGTKTTTGDDKDSEPKIAALWSSSDHSPNITQGQDLGWRMAPEVVVEMKKIKQDMRQLEHIAQRFGKLVEDIGESDILNYISRKTTLDAAPTVETNDYEDDYDAQIRALEVAEKDPGFVPPASVTTTTTKSLDQLRAELAEREAAEAPTTTQTTTEAPTTTETTTEAPSTTDTTTQAG